MGGANRLRAAATGDRPRRGDHRRLRGHDLSDPSGRPHSDGRWERHFVLDWTVEREQSDARRSAATSTTSTESLRERTTPRSGVGTPPGRDRPAHHLGSRSDRRFGRAYFEVRISRRRPLSADGLDYTLIQSADTGKKLSRAARPILEPETEETVL